MKIRLKVKTLSVLISSFRCGLQQGGKYCSLTSVVQQIESRKAHKTLRSAVRIPTLSADCIHILAILKVEGGFLIFISFVV